MVKNPPAVLVTQVWFLGQEDPLEKGMATYSRTLAWRISWTEEPGGLQSMGSVGRKETQLSNFHFFFTFQNVKHSSIQALVILCPHSLGLYSYGFASWTIHIHNATSGSFIPYQGETHSLRTLSLPLGAPSRQPSVLTLSKQSEMHGCLTLSSWP